MKQHNNPNNRDTSVSPAASPAAPRARRARRAGARVSIAAATAGLLVSAYSVPAYAHDDPSQDARPGVTLAAAQSSDRSPSRSLQEFRQHSGFQRGHDTVGHSRIPYWVIAKVYQGRMIKIAAAKAAAEKAAAEKAAAEKAAAEKAAAEKAAAEKAAAEKAAAEKAAAEKAAAEKAAAEKAAADKAAADKAAAETTAPVAEGGPTAEPVTTTAPAASPAPASAGVLWPVASDSVSRGFGPRPSPCSGCSTNHKGLDLTPGAGSTVGSVAAGVVSTVGSSSGGYGVYVIVDHVINGKTVSSLYAHMQSGSVAVKKGQTIAAGQKIGRVGSTGASTGAHLHLEIRINGTAVDPLAWLRANLA